ncbi:MAG: DUF1611 domain-containing protein [Candidatus Binatia bacterium]
MEENAFINSPPCPVAETTDLLGNNVRWTWACRILDRPESYTLDAHAADDPHAGDLALVRVTGIGNHSRMVTADNKKLRIYVGDLLVGVFGNRYATDAFEGEVQGVGSLSVLTAGGMIGTVKSQHRQIDKSTDVAFIGFLRDEKGRRANLKRLKFRVAFPKNPVRNLLVVIGTGMNSGKTTVAVKLIKGLSEMGLRVAACKLTGSVSNRDQDEMRAAAARSVIDFSDYGFPSTYLCGKAELLDLCSTILADTEKVQPDVIIMEVADGFLQRETAMLLAEPSIKKIITGLVFTADSAPAALYGVERLRQLHYPIIAVSGALTSAPLAVQEFREQSDMAVGSSADSGKGLVKLVRGFLDAQAGARDFQASTSRRWIGLHNGRRSFGSTPALLRAS